jgi:hypothetical protein
MRGEVVKIRLQRFDFCMLKLYEMRKFMKYYQHNSMTGVLRKRSLYEWTEKSKMERQV